MVSDWNMYYRHLFMNNTFLSCTCIWIITLLACNRRNHKLSIYDTLSHIIWRLSRITVTRQAMLLAWTYGHATMHFLHMWPVMAGPAIQSIAMIVGQVEVTLVLDSSLPWYHLTVKWPELLFTEVTSRKSVVSYPISPGVTLQGVMHSMPVAAV